MSTANLSERVFGISSAGLLSPLDAARLTKAKPAYTTRRVPLQTAAQLLTGDVAPQSGDLVLAQVDRLGQHQRIELPTGRRAQLNPGDEIVVCYGARYAPDQFEAFVPDDLGPCHLVAGGGIAAACREKHGSIKAPTQIVPVGLLADSAGRRLNLADHALPAPPQSSMAPPLVAVVGTMMNAGKTTCAANLVRGLKRRGLRVGAAKVTGTGAGGDRWLMIDCGADVTLDFTDAGVASTAGLEQDRIEAVFRDLVAHVAAEVDAIVIEIADGLFQRETAMLLESQGFRLRCSGLIFAASDALGAMAGVRQLERNGHRVLAVGGTLTASPLATREARQVLSVPVVTSEQLVTGWWMPFPELRSFPTAAAAVMEGRQMGTAIPVEGNGQAVAA